MLSLAGLRIGNSSVMRGHIRGATAYREQNNVPLIVVHPAYPGGRRCKAVSSHLDIAPTLVSLTNASPQKKAAITKHLPGKDLSPLLAAPEKASYTAIRALFDGRYRFARYFSPRQHNRPDSAEALFKLNDVELYDVERDPLERDNLAVDRGKHAEILEAMNAKLNALIEKEVGEDGGQMLPGGVDGAWVVTDAVYDV